MSQKILITLSLTLLVSCAGIKNKNNVPEKDNLVEVEIETASEEPTETVKSEVIDFKKYDHPSIAKWKKYFTDQNPQFFDEVLQRGQFYKEVVQTILEENGVPHELYFLALIESGFRNHARSHASAVGMWQFIQGTAKRYALDVNRYVDVRRNPIRATEAASKYLKDLYNVFNSWPLAIAAYNCGEMRVLNAIMKGNSRNFWDLYDKKLLPRETREYVPKFLAAAELGEKRYNEDSFVNATSSYPDVELIEIPPHTDIKKLAQHLKIDYSEFKKINPHLKTSYSPGPRYTLEIWIPEVKKNIALNSLHLFKRAPVKEKYTPDQKIHVVRKGDSLHRIAIRYDIPISRIKRLNNIKSNRIYPKQKLLLKSQKYVSSRGSKYYFVKRGDNLSSIARKYGMKISKLKRSNGLSSSRIFAGQKLRVTGSPSGHLVKRGDTLSKIARKYGKSITYIKKVNRLKKTQIYIGQNIRL